MGTIRAASTDTSPRRNTDSSAKDAHPSYPNPTIAEALCEIHFRRPTWEDALVGEVFKALQAELPILEPTVEFGLEVRLGATGLEQQLFQPRQRVRFRSLQRPVVAQISERVFTVNVLSPYPGWERMKSDVLQFWGTVARVVQAQEITRIGLRYINRIERTRPDERAREWLQSSPYVPQAALESHPGFLVRLEVRPDPAARLLITLGDDAPQAAPGSILFDIDRIVEKPVSCHKEAVEAAIETLHEEVWKVFSSTKGPRLTERLEGKRS
jgi:uncharacterized protein (TIGR04255 family)